MRVWWEGWKGFLLRQQNAFFVLHCCAWATEPEAGERHIQRRSGWFSTRTRTLPYHWSRTLEPFRTCPGSGDPTAELFLHAGSPHSVAFWRALVHIQQNQLDPAVLRSIRFASLSKPDTSTAATQSYSATTLEVSAHCCYMHDAPAFDDRVSQLSRILKE